VADPNPDTAEQAKRSGFKRDLGLLDVTVFGVGVIVGAGIYAIIGAATGLAGNMLWLSLLIAAAVALLSALTYAELVSAYPDAGGGYEYVAQAFGRKWALIIGIAMMLTGVVASAAIAIAFAEYLARLWEVPQVWAATGALLAMLVVNAIGVQHSSWTNMVATAVTLGGLALVIGFGLPHIGQVDLLQTPPQGYIGVVAAAALAFFAYVGFEDVVKLAEETRDPKTTVGKGILIAGVAVLIIYVLTATAAVAALDWQRLSESKGPLAEVMRSQWGQLGATIIIVVALFATLNSILTNVLGTSRLVMDMAREAPVKWLNFFTWVAPKLQTPLPAIAAVGGVTFAFILIGDLKVVASISNMFIFITFLTVNAALIRLRVRPTDNYDPRFRVPLSVGKIPVPTAAGIVLLLILMGFNIYNLVGGSAGGH
jgi:amino acid transporter